MPSCHTKAAKTERMDSATEGLIASLIGPVGGRKISSWAWEVWSPTEAPAAMAAEGSGVGILFTGSAGLGGGVAFFFFRLEDFVGLSDVSEADSPDDFFGLCIGSSGLVKVLPVVAVVTPPPVMVVVVVVVAVVSFLSIEEADSRVGLSSLPDIAPAEEESAVSVLFL